MKEILFLFILSAITLSLIGCQTVPRQLVREEVVIIYYEPVYIDPPYIPEPPTPGPPTQPIIRPGIDNPNPPRDQQSKIPDNGGSYGNRDRLQGGDNRESGEIKTYPPVRKPKQNDRVQ
jgi:hypothetical protein